MDTIRIDTQELEEISQKARHMGDSAANAAQSLSSLLLEVRMVASSQHGAIETLDRAKGATQSLSKRTDGFSHATTIALQDWIACENRLMKRAIMEGEASAASRLTGDDKAMSDYEQLLYRRYKDAIDPETRKLYEIYLNRLPIGNDDTFFIKTIVIGSRIITIPTDTPTAYYNPNDGKIYYNRRDDSTNPRGPGQQYYHEVGHAIDDLTTGPGDSSSDQAFTKALKSDFDKYVKNTMEQQHMTEKEAYKYISDRLKVDGDQKNGLSDLMGGLSGNKCRGNWMHENKYWNAAQEYGTPEKLNNEAFAHFFEASMSTDSVTLDYLKEAFPTAYRRRKGYGFPSSRTAKTKPPGTPG